MRLTIILSLAAVLTLGLNGCGYQLKGSDSALNHSVNLVVNSENDEYGVAESLSAMAKHGASIDAAELVVDLSNTNVTRRALSYDSSIAVAQYSVEMTIWVRVTDAQGKELSAIQPIRTSGVYDFDRDNVLAREHEQRILEQELADKLAKQVLTLTQMLASKQ